MGTKVEGKSYLPGYFAMRDPNLSSNSSWSRYYEEKTSSGPPDDWFMSGPATGYSEYDKEMLKRTMLEHEAIFRKQVYELHRLYRIQKDLMQEFQKKELFRYPLPANTSNSNSFSSQMPSNGAKLNWQMPLFHTGYENAPITHKVEIKSSLNFLKEGSVQSSPNGITKKMFDLRLPADVYIDNEEEKRSFKKNKSIQIDNGNDIKLTLGSVNGFNCREDGWVSDSHTQNNHNSLKMADLNQPFRETYCEGVADSASTDFLGLKNFSAENHLPHSSTRWNTGVLAFQRDLFKEKRADEGSSSYLFSVNEKIRQENSFITRENGKGAGTMNNFFTHNFCNPEPQRSSEPADMKLKRNHETLPLDQSNAMDWFRPKMTDLPNASSCALPSYLNGFHIHQESFGDRYLEGMRSKNLLPDGFRDGVTTQQDRTLCNLGRRFEESVMEINWLRKKAAFDESVGLKKPQASLSFLQGAAQEPNSKCENESGVSIRPDFNSTSQPKWHIMERDEASKDTSTRILGIPIYDKIQKSALFLPISHQEQSPNVDKDTEKASGKSSTTLRNLINLNDEYSEPLDVSPEILEVNPPPTPVASASAKSTFEIDLEAPLCPVEDDINPPQESVITINADNSQEKELQHDSFDIQAANNIIAMSMDVKSCLERPSPPCSGALQRLAEIITSNTENAEKSSDNEGLDLFECMTLKLQETKIDEYLCKPKALLDKNEDGEKASASASSLLFTKSRRGQARRRRQRRDFQKDILPGLASLSRHEVTEDLQTIGGLMKACGSSWEMGLMGRNGRNGSRARRQRRSLAVTVEEIRVSPPPQPPVLQPIIADVDEGRGIIGWGRTTRRCRRPRCHPGSSAAPLS